MGELSLLYAMEVDTGVEWHIIMYNELQRC